MKKAVVFILFLFIPFLVTAQTPDLLLESGVGAHREIDAVYASFTRAYRQLNVDLVTDLYTADANYLAPGNPMSDGREKIREGFARFFEYVKKNGQTMEVKFRILSREVDQKLGYDLGVYTINTFKDGKQIGQGQGKFFVVTKKIGDRWFFRFDGYSDLKPEKKESQTGKTN
jgi:uncharacterized protein (TIGR02246 family)